jgi:hypothetical protein
MVSGIPLAGSLMKRTLLFLLGIWAFAAPAACLALCPASAIATESRAVTAAQPMAPCHGNTSGDRSLPNSEPAPERSDDCCLEQRSGLIQAGAPEAPRAPLVFAFGTVSEIANTPAPTDAYTVLLDVGWTRTPHLQANPPLLI